MSKTQSIIRGTLILTLAGILTRLIGFYYRIFLSHTFGEEAVGLYQLVFPVYALFFSLTCAGIQTAISRLTARCTAVGKSLQAVRCLMTGLIISCTLSILCMIFLQQTSPVIALHFLGDQRCAPLLYAMTYAFPFGAVHSSLCGYYLGQRRTNVPAFSQLLEQLARVSTVFLLCHFSLRQHFTPNIVFAVLGLAAGEMISSFYAVFYFLTEQRQQAELRPAVRGMFQPFKSLMQLAIPLSTSRILLNLLQSVEAVSIPHSLKVYGLTTAEALSVYGVLTGMALPCILFPSAVTNSMSSMLMPTVAELQASKNQTALHRLVSKVVFFCIFIGIICCTGFLLAGNVIGQVLFHSSLAGTFIVTLAWICPFLYLNTALLSILNGFGKTSSTLLINMVGLTVRIISVYLIIPFCGIQGYLWGLLLSQILITLSSFFLLKRIS